MSDLVMWLVAAGMGVVAGASVWVVWRPAPPGKTDAGAVGPGEDDPEAVPPLSLAIDDPTGGAR